MKARHSAVLCHNENSFLKMTELCDTRPLPPKRPPAATRFCTTLCMRESSPRGRMMGKALLSPLNEEHKVASVL